MNKDKKRVRRTAAEIERKYKCKEAGCSKSYGTEGALKMHKKLKHAPQRATTKYPIMHGGYVSKLPLIYPAPKRLLPSLPGMKNVPVAPQFTPSWFYDVSQYPISEQELLIPTEITMPSEMASESYELPCGSVYFNLINNPTNSLTLFCVSSIKIGGYTQHSNTEVDLSLYIDTKRKTISYFIEECTQSLSSLQLSTSLKIEYSIDSVNEYLIDETAQHSLIVGFSLKSPPRYYSCSLPRGQLVAYDTLPWTEVRDFTEERGSTYRFNIIRIPSDSTTAGRLTSILNTQGIKLNPNDTVTLDDSTVLPITNQIHKYEVAILEQRFDRKGAGTFVEDQPESMTQEGFYLPSLPRFTSEDKKDDEETHIFSLGQGFDGSFADLLDFGEQ